MNKLLKISAVVFVLLSVFTAMRAPAAVRNLAGFGTTVYGENDDGSFPCTSTDVGIPDNCTPTTVPIGFTLNFYSRSFSELYVNNNGNVTFDSELGTFTPFGLVATATEIIAPFFADVDTRAGNVVTFGNDTVDGHPAFGVNWINVGFYSQSIDKLNTFQLVLIERSDRNPGDFDIEFNYDQVQWEAGDASGGNDGLGGSSAVAGFSNGSGLPGTSFQLHGSAIPGQFLDTNPGGLSHGSLNSTVPGRYVMPIVNLTNKVLNVQRFAQGDPLWGTNVYGGSAFTIQQKGSALTALAMALKYAGVATDPGALNTVLTTHGDFVCTSLNWTAAARDAANSTLEFHSFRTSDFPSLSQALGDGHPVIVGVNLNDAGVPTHFVVVIGYQNGDFLIRDPGQANRTSLAAYGNKFETRGYVAHTAGDVSGLGISVDTPAELFVVDPLGRRSGYVSGLILEEIPRSYHFLDTPEASDLSGAPGADTARQVDMFQPMQGVYQLFLLGLTSGNYKLTLRSFSSAGAAGTPVTFTGTMKPSAVLPFQVTLGASGLTVQPFTNHCVWTASPTNGPVPLFVQFTAPSVDTGGRTLTQYSWNFGDGVTSALQSPSHTYTNGGIFFPSLTVINDLGLTEIGFGPSIAVPVVAFTADPISGSPPLTVQFHAAAVDNLGNAVSQWNWDFGDGETIVGQNPSHNYNSVAVFSPSLFATNSSGVEVTGVGPKISTLPSTGLVLNGGFETGDFTGWTVSGDLFDMEVDSDPYGAYTGSFGALLDPFTLSYLSQPLPTVPGKTYLISLWLDNDGDTLPNELTIGWGGITLVDWMDLPATGWTNIQVLAVASSASTMLSIGVLDEGFDYLGLDDVSVFPVQPTISGITLSGTDLVLHGLNGLAGRSYRLLRTANPGLPLNQWTPVVTNVVAASGSFTMTIPNAVDPHAPQRFYSLQLQ